MDRLVLVALALSSPKALDDRCGLPRGVDLHHVDDALLQVAAGAQAGAAADQHGDPSFAGVLVEPGFLLRVLRFLVEADEAARHAAGGQCLAQRLVEDELLVRAGHAEVAEGELQAAAVGFLVAVVVVVDVVLVQLPQPEQFVGGDVDLLGFVGGLVDQAHVERGQAPVGGDPQGVVLDPLALAVELQVGLAEADAHHALAELLHHLAQFRGGLGFQDSHLPADDGGLTELEIALEFDVGNAEQHALELGLVDVPGVAGAGGEGVAVRAHLDPVDGLDEGGDELVVLLDAPLVAQQVGGVVLDGGQDLHRAVVHRRGGGLGRPPAAVVLAQVGQFHVHICGDLVAFEGEFADGGDHPEVFQGVGFVVEDVGGAGPFELHARVARGLEFVLDPPLQGGDLVLDVLDGVLVAAVGVVQVRLQALDLLVDVVQASRFGHRDLFERGVADDDRVPVAGRPAGDELVTALPGEVGGVRDEDPGPGVGLEELALELPQDTLGYGVDGLLGQAQAGQFHPADDH